MARKLKGGAIQSNTITITQIQTTAVTNIVTQSGPRVSSLIYPGDDTAGNTVGGQTVYINGSGFETNNAIYISGNAVPSKSFISASNLSFTTPALAAGIYPVYVINTDSGSTAIFIPGYISSAEPAWVTSAGSLTESQDELSVWSYSLSATGDAPITYALAGGSSLPTGVSLAANGLISGTITSPSGNTTTYTFSVIATDAQNQDSTRQFTATTTTGEGVLFANNVLLIHADGTNNKNNHTFLDSSNNNFTITRANNATQGSFSPFSQTGWSGYFDGTGDYLNTSNNAAFTFGTGDLTIEGWIYQTATSTSTYRVIFGDNVYGSTGGYTLYSYNNALNLWKGGAPAAELIAPAGTITLNTWTHVAWTRSGSSNRLFINGTQVGNTTTDATNYTSTASYIGASQSGTLPFAGYISNARILKGTALYTANSSPPTTSLTNIANTSLLTLQSNRFIDNSNNNFTITRNGDTSIQAFSPFAPTAPYSTANVGGSGYFDGSGDRISVANNSSLDLGTGDFTVECWVYSLTALGSYTAAYAHLMGKGNGNVTGTYSLAFYLSKIYFASPGATTGTTTLTANQWYHLAVTRSGTTLRLFVNGAVEATATVTTDFTSASSFNIGDRESGDVNGQYPLNGYISNARVVKGTAVYTAAFTPPTAPLTNIANTSLLCNFTNAGIFDQTAKNVLETVGDAKVSTAQYKYGTGSMYFDGTGDWLILPRSQLFNFGTGNLTIEGWINVPNSNSTYKTIFSIGSPVQIYSVSGTVEAYFNDSDNALTYIVNPASGPSSSVAANTWCHFAIVRNGTTFTTYVNGIGGTPVTGVTAAIAYSATAPYIGTIGSDPSQYPFTGYIDDLRITKGYARYTSTFTPPTSALKDR